MNGIKNAEAMLASLIEKEGTPELKQAWKAYRKTVSVLLQNIAIKVKSLDSKISAMSKKKII